MQQKPKKSIFNRLVRFQEFKIISIRLEIRNQNVEMHQIPSMKEKSATSSAKPVSLVQNNKMVSHLGRYRPVGRLEYPRIVSILRYFQFQVNFIVCKIGYMALCVMQFSRIKKSDALVTHKGIAVFETIY